MPEGVQRARVFDPLNSPWNKAINSLVYKSSLLACKKISLFGATKPHKKRAAFQPLIFLIV